MAELTLGQVITRRFELDAQIDAIKARHKAELAPFNEELNMCEQFVRQEMLKDNQQNVKINGVGMTYFTTKDKVTVENFETVLAEIREKGLWSMLTAALSKTAVKEYIDEHGAPPVGTKYETYRDLNWRRGG